MKRAQMFFFSLLIALTVSTFFGFRSFTNTNPTDHTSKTVAKINWVSMEEAVAAAKNDGKKILVDLTTVWCGWCKKMDKDTYSNANVINFINTNFHAVKFDAEKTTREISINGKTYKHLPNVGRNGIHEWAATMMNGRPSYPSTAILDANSKIITNVPGYKKAGEMIMILSFLSEDAYKTTSWQAYQLSYKKR